MLRRGGVRGVNVWVKRCESVIIVRDSEGQEDPVYLNYEHRTCR